MQLADGEVSSGLAPLSPVSFLARSAAVFGSRTAVVEGDLRVTYRELDERARRLAGLLVARGIRPGDRVAVLAPNTLLLLEAHFGVPPAGAALNALNTRLSTTELAYIVEHAGAPLLLPAQATATPAEEVAAKVCGVTVLVGGRPGDAYGVALAAPAHAGTAPKNGKK